MAADSPRSGFLEYKQRLVYSLLRAAVRLALRFKLPLDQFAKLGQMAYFEEAKATRGLQMNEIAELFDKSLRTLTNLHQEYRGDFFSPEREVQLRRDVVNVLTRAPCDYQKLEAHFPEVSRSELFAAVDDLIRERRVITHEDVLRRNPEHQPFYDPGDIKGRVAGLNRQMDIVAATVWNRLVEDPPREPARARYWVFDAKPEQFSHAMDALMNSMRDKALELEGTALEESEAVRFGVTLAATPLEDE